MRTSEEGLSAASAFAASSEAAEGWHACGIELREVNDFGAALLTVRRGCGERLAAQASQCIGAPLPPDRGVSSRGPIAIVSCGHGRYLALRRGDSSGTLASSLDRQLQGLAAVVDSSDQFAFLSLDGAQAPHLLSMLFALDFDSNAFPAGTAAVARMRDVRAHLWREDEGGPFMIGVQRSFARGCWEMLLECCRTLASAPAT